MKTINNLKELAVRACSGIYSDPEATAQRQIDSYTNDLNSLLSEIPVEYHTWVSEKYISLLSAWFGSQTSIYSSFISGRSNFPVQRMEKLNRWADNHYKRFSDWREDIVRRVKKWEKKKNYSLSSEVEQQQEKVAELKEWQETMKKVNKIVRSKKLTEEEVKDELANMGISEETAYGLLNPRYSYQSKGFQGFELTNNNNRLKNAESRLAELQRRLEAEGQENTSYDINGVTVEEDIAENRIKLFFPSKPSEQIRTKLKQNGYRWSPRNECWQAYMSAKRYVKDLLEGMDI